jgi:dTDP-4-amino-4,6-dideoxygalactose transaminase
MENGGGLMKVPLLDLKAQYAAIRADVDAAVAAVLESQQFILGPAVEACEQAIARYCGAAHAVGVSSGTDALLACLMAESIGPGDEVITTPYTFFATAGAIARLGATPVFVDIDPATCNLDPAGIASKVTSRTKAIIPVHLYGQLADIDAVMQVAEAHGLVVIEDAAQAIGAVHKGHQAGTVGHYGCFSFFPSKNLGAAGDGGMIVTSDPERAAKLVCLRAHGSQPKYHHRLVGGNFRLDAIQAAVVSAKLPYLDGWTAARQRNARRYDQLFERSGLDVADSAVYALRGGTTGERLRGGGAAAGSPHLFLPAVVTDRHIFNQYVVRVARRDELKAALHRCGVATEVYYPVPMHLQECFAFLGHGPGAFPESERAAEDTLALPVHPEVTEAQAQYVVDCIRDFLLAPTDGASARPHPS